MQLETEVRSNPELRADRFVQAWQQMRRERDKLSGWDNEEKRQGLEGRMRAMVKRLGADTDLGARQTRQSAGAGQAMVSGMVPRQPQWRHWPRAHQRRPHPGRHVRADGIARSGTRYRN